MPSAFEKRVKRRVIARSHTFFVVCPPGLGATCARELAALGDEIQNITPLPGGVEFSGKLTAGYLAHLCLASPSRILMRLARFKADSFAKLEKQLSALDWELFLPANAELEVKASLKKSRLYHSDAVSQRCLEVVGKALAQRGEYEADQAEQTLMVRAENDHFDLSLDMSGTPLYKRGIKTQITPAPLRETLAFAILTAAGFSPALPVLDPMCGSGTFSFETARIKAGIPAGFCRSFAFEAWPAFKPGQLAFLKRELTKGIALPPQKDIFASDLDPRVLEILRANLAGPAHWPDELPETSRDFLSTIQPRRENFFDLTPPTGKPGIILLNPPYGKRLDKGMDTRAFYREMGDKLRRDFKGWKLGMIFPGAKMWKLPGLPLSPLPFFHGGLDLTAGLGQI